MTLTAQEQKKRLKAKSIQAVEWLNNYRQFINHPHQYPNNQDRGKMIDGVVDCFKELQHSDFIPAFLHCTSNTDRLDERLLDWINYTIQLHKSLLYKKADWNY